jgi:hypothetical protein
MLAASAWTAASKVVVVSIAKALSLLHLPQWGSITPAHAGPPHAMRGFPFAVRAGRLLLIRRSYACLNGFADEIIIRRW